MNRVIAIGCVNLDTTFVVDRLPLAGETVAARLVERGYGGKAANQACAATRHGAHAILIAAVGADPETIAAVADLRRCGVDVSGMYTERSAMTGRAVITRDHAG